MPVVAVPTTAGTGSEVTPYAIFTDHKKKTKLNYGHRVFPKIAFLDAKYMCDMPLNLTRHTALDAFSHLAESYLNTKSNAFSEIYVRAGVELFGKCIKPLREGNISMQDRENLLLASTYAGIAIAQTATTLPHAMGYALTYFGGVSHGMANALLYREFFGAFEDKTRINELILWLGFDSESQFMDIVDELLGECMATFSDNILKEQSAIVFANKAKLAGHPESITEEKIFEIYRKSVR